MGGSFSVAPHFLGTTFARTRAFSFSIRFSAPLSSLCLLAYCKSLHTIRDGIKYEGKKVLLKTVLDFIEENREAAKEEFAQSAQEVIKVLQEIEEKLFPTDQY